MGSRRGCEELIRAGLVTVNGQRVTEQGHTVDPATSIVLVRGTQVQPQQKVYFALNKPPGVLCTVRDTHGRPTVLSLLPRDRGRLYPVGRLDADSEGLLFITNDGDFAQHISHPRHHIEKRYHVWSSATLTTSHLASMTQGIRHEGELLRARRVRLLRQGTTGARYEIILGEGKNRQLRRMFEACGLKITRLRRDAIGPIPLGKLRPGEWRELRSHEIRRLISAAESKS